MLSEEEKKAMELIKEDIEVLEDYAYAMCTISCTTEQDKRIAQAIENLIKGYKELKEKNNNVAVRLEYYLIDNFAIEENPNKVREEFEKLLNMLQEGDINETKM